MNKLDSVFKSGKKNLLNVYCTAGYPHLSSTAEVLMALQNNGADMVEVGMPYSDPIADGPVIQESNMVALNNGMDMHILFQQLDIIKMQLHIPVILMGYLNPVLQFGIENFCEAAAKAGVSAVIIPDLPFYEFELHYRSLFRKHNIHFIFLVTPGTTPERLKNADRLSSGFLYMVSSSSTTGQSTATFNEGYFKALGAAKLKNPVMIGFGIRDKETFSSACAYADGAIIGSAYIKAISNSINIDLDTKNFIGSILN